MVKRGEGRGREGGDDKKEERGGGDSGSERDDSQEGVGMPSCPFGASW